MNLHPRRGRSDPTFPIPPYTHSLASPGYNNTDSKVQGRKAGQNPATSNQGFSSHYEAGARRVGGVAPAGRQAQGLGGGSVTHHGAAPGGGSQPRTAGRGGKGEEGRGSKRERGCDTPDSWHPSHAKTWTAAAPPPLERGAPPLPVRLGGGGGAEVGIGGRASEQRTGSAIGCVGPSRGPRLAAETRSV